MVLWCAYEVDGCTSTARYENISKHEAACKYRWMMTANESAMEDWIRKTEFKITCWKGCGKAINSDIEYEHHSCTMYLLQQREEL